MRSQLRYGPNYLQLKLYPIFSICQAHGFYSFFAFLLVNLVL